MHGRRSMLQWLAAVSVGSAPVLGDARGAAAQAPQQVDPWPDLAAQVFGGRAIGEGSALLAIQAPYRAEDAAIVPVTLSATLPPGDTRRLRVLTLVIDQNPSPLAAAMSFGPRGPNSISTRVRVDSYTNLHLVAELSDGRLYGTKRYVKAAGGCSAPASPVEAGGPPIGTMRLRQFAATPESAGAREALLMIRHPNNSGMQMDQLTRLYVPAHFITKLRVAADDELLFSFDLGISMSENPQFRFPLPPGPIRRLRAEAKDNEGGDFKGEWPINPAA